MADEQPPQDYAGILKDQYASMQVKGPQPRRYKMSDRNRKKLEKIRQRVKQLRGQS